MKSLKKQASKRPPATSLEEVTSYHIMDNEIARKKATKGIIKCKNSSPDDIVKLDCITGKKDCIAAPLRSNFELALKLAELWTTTFLKRQAEEPNLEFLFGTILHEPWDTSSENTVIDVHQIQRETRGAITAIVPNWVAVPECQLFANIRHRSGGLVVGNHPHFLGFGVGIFEKAEAAARKLQPRFRSRFPDVASIKVVRVTNTPVDLARVIHYLWKPPTRCKTLYRNDEKKKANLHESEANDRFIRYWRLIQILMTLRVDRMVYAGGQGQSIRQDSMREALSWLRTGEANRNPPLHSDETARYLADWAVRTEETRFRLPVVRLKKQ